MSGVSVVYFFLMSSPNSTPSPSSDGLNFPTHGTNTSPLPRESESRLVSSDTPHSLPVSSSHGFSSFSDALRRGVGNLNSGVDLPSSSSLDIPSSSANPPLVGNQSSPTIDPSGPSDSVVPPMVPVLLWLS